MKTSLSYKFARAVKRLGVNHNSESDSAVIAMRREIANLDGGQVNFSVSIDRDGSWYAESTNVDGLLTGGDNQAEIDEMLKDAIFTYYNIESRHADDALLRSSGDVTNIKQQVQLATR